MSSGWITSHVLPLEILDCVGVLRMDNQSCDSSGDSELGRVSSGWIKSPVIPLEILSWVGCPQGG